MSFAQLNSGVAAPLPGAEDIAGFLRDAVAAALDVRPETVDAHRPLRDLGLDSVRILSLVAVLSEHLGRPVPGWVVWQYPTVAGLAAHLAGEDAPPAAAPRPGRTPAAANEPVAIVGLGCRLPGGIETPEALWESLCDGLDAIREVPADRWNAREWLDPDPRAPGRMNTRWGGFLDDVAGFDADLFRISPAEAKHMDPQQRMALEVAWAALEDARIVPTAIAGTRTGVFFGTMAQEYHLATGADADDIGTHSAVGWDNSIIPARIAYTLGLHGPAMAVATACSSSLTATHLAVQSLRRGETDLALAGGVNIMLHPHTTVAMTKFGGMNPDGQCRAFDAGANGYVRGEGCGAVVLRRLSDALAAGDRVYAVIRGTAVNNDGASNGLTAPNPRAQVDVVRTAWQDADVDPKDVSYVEAHGTGTLLGDPIEAEALGTVFAEGREEPLHLGSAKTNFGHLEPAAGVTGLLKTALSLYHGEIPASLHFDVPNPHIDFEANKLSVVAERRPWPAARRRYAGVSGFGFGGTNAHVALEEAPCVRRRLVPLAAATEEALNAAIAGAATTEDPTTGPLPAPDAVGPHRAVVAPAPDATGTHRAVVAPAPAGRAELVAGPTRSGQRPHLAFFFSGHGAQWLGMGRDLLSEPAFRAALDDCDRAVAEHTGWSVTDELLADPASSRLDRTDVVQPVLFSVQVALARTLTAWGPEPDTVFGQSIGEVAAAVVAGALPLDEGARLITTWSALIAERASGHGALLVCDLTADGAARPAADHGLSVAGHLAPDQVCLSGPANAVAAAERELSENGVRTARVNIDYASHSAGLEDLAPELVRRLGTLRTGVTSIPFRSTVDDDFVDGTALGAEYWARNMCRPMLVAEAVAALTRTGPAAAHGLTVVEIAPHPVARHSLERTLTALGATRSAALATCRRDRPARRSLEDLVARLWCEGHDIGWTAVHGRSDRPALKTPVVLTVSGKSEEARAENAARLADHLTGRPDAELLDIAYSAAHHRAHLDHRASAVASTTDRAREALLALAEGRAHRDVVEGCAVGGELAVLFTGQGSQRIAMGRQLYGAFPVFREAFDEVCAALEPHLRVPLAAVVFAPEDSADAVLVHETEFTQPGLFAVGVALFRLWESWGVVPGAVAGHSVGEVAAAHVAGVLGLGDAARLVAARGRLMQGCERGGSMASVEASEPEVVEVLADVAVRVSVAGLNGPAQTVVSGDTAAVDAVVEHFAGLGRRTRRLEVSHAFHSPHMDAMLDAYREVVESCVFGAPGITVVSTVTGGVVSGEELADPGYWVRQVRDGVRFLDAVRCLERSGVSRYLECGPAGVLSAMGAGCVQGEAVFTASQRTPRGADEPVDEVRSLLRALGELHVSGQDIAWDRVLVGGTPVDLPTYAFRRKHHWIEPKAGRNTGRNAGKHTGHGRPHADDALWQAVGSGESERVSELLGVTDSSAVATLLPYLATWREQQDRAGEVADWSYEETWQPSPVARTAPLPRGHWLIVAPAAAQPLAGELAGALTAAGASPHLLTADTGTDTDTGAGTDTDSGAGTDRAAYAASIGDLIAELGDEPLRGVLALTAADTAPHPDHPAVTTGAARSLALVQALGDTSVRAPLWFVTQGAVRAHDTDPAPAPAQALAWGLGHVVALEHANRWGGLVDLPAEPDPTTLRRLLATLAAHGTPGAEEHIALRPADRLVRRLRRTSTSTATATARPWTPRGTVLITGGSGALAAHLAHRLAERGAEHLVLASRRGPDAEGAAELTAALEAAGTRVTLAPCDVTDRRQLDELLTALDHDEAPLRAVFHTAGVLDDRLIDRLDAEALAAVAAPKLTAATHLHELTRDRDLDAFVLYSSVVGTLGNIGQANYAMANAALDALAAARRAEGLPAVSIGWGPWADGGMTHGAAENQLRRIGFEPMPAERALDALDTALDRGGSTVVAGIDWPRAAAAYTEGGDRPFLHEVPEARAAIADAPAEQAHPLRTTLLALPEDARENHLRSLLAVEAAAVLGAENPASLDLERGFKDLGFDSMMAVDLSVRVQKRTGVITPKTLIFDHPNLAAAARWLLGEIAPALTSALTETSAAVAAHRSDEPLAVVGVGLHMPGDAHDLDSLWDVLAEGRDTVREVPADRFDIDAFYDPDPDAEGRTYARHASFLDDVAHFDAAFFGISPREAEPMDPQHRLLLEAAWNSLENAGIRPRELRDSRTGVFVGAGVGEYGKYRPNGAPDTYTLTGTLPSFNAGRLSYHLGLQGPALSIDTACSSSLVALHLACEALRNDECELALAGGVQVLTDPGAFIALSRSHALSPDGRSKAFSAEADGYGRGEGVGVIAVMRLSDAIEQNRTVLGVIRATAINHDGASSGITAPNGSSQQKVIRAALRSAGLSTEDVDYVECHGTGTALGDPIEVQALAAVYGEGREPGRELGLGTAKSVIGHLESAAGIAGVCKMLASFRKDALPGTRYSSPRNPNIAWDDLPVRVVDELTPWARDEGRVRRAGVSSFGLSGTNAHVIVEEPPVVGTPEPVGVSGGPVPVVVSGRDEAALREQAGRWASWLSDLSGREGVRVADVAVTAARHRTHFESRASVVASDAAGLVEALEALAEGRSHDAVVTGTAGRRGKVVFVYPGQGSQWIGMGRELLDSSAVFAEAVDACDAALLPFTGWSVREVLAGEEGEHPPFDRVDVVQPALFAMGVALSALWRSLGVEPAAVVGHSQGEVVAAVVSGALTLEEGAQIVAQRSRAVLACAGQGGMALIERPVAVVEEFLAPYGDALSVAAVNTSGSTVISGQADAIERIVAELQEKEIYARRINVDYASHNAQMDPLLPALAQGFEGLAPRRADLAFYSTVTGEVSDGTGLDGTYWCRNLREPVRFDRALDKLLDDGHTVFVEISAHPVLSMPLTDGSAERGGIVVGSLARRTGGAAQLLRNLGLLHVQGHEIDWDRALGLAPDAAGSLLNLPTYAFQREHYWLPVPKATGDAGSLGLETSPHPWLGAVTELADGEGHLFTGRLSLTEQPWLKDHTVFGTVIVPGTGLLELALTAAHHVGAAGVAELTLAEPLVIDEAVRIQITVGAPGANGRRHLTIHSRPDDTQDDWTRHASGELREESADPAPDDFAELRHWPVAGAERVDLDGFYDRFGAQGIDYGPAFRGLTELWRKGDTAYGIVRLPGTAGSTGAAAAPTGAAAGAEYHLHPALLDTALHIMKGVIPARGAEEPEGALLPFEWSDVELYAAGSAELRVRIDVEASEAGQEIRVRAADATGEPVVRIGGLHLRRATAEQLRAARNTGADGLHRLEFQPVRAPAPQGAVADAVLTGTGELAALIGVRTLSDIDELTALLDSGPQAPARVVVDTTGRPPFYSEPEAAYKATEYVLAQLQELLSDDRLDSTELVWVTRGSVAAAPGDRLGGLPYAPLWGLIRSARAEHPERGLRLIDLGPDDADRDALARALAVTGEPELAVREGEVLAARLVREAPTAATADGALMASGVTARPLDPEGTVLITGGTGELGRETARHLVRHHGVRHLVLTSRRGAEAPGAAELVHELEEEGARCVRVVACDVARRDDVAQVLGLAEEGRPWTAVLHLAGILDDGVLLGQDAERLSRVMAPKVKGALYLDELTRDLDLAAFVLFSSAAGTVGTAGQSIYGAANTYLDAFAARRRAEGRPATSLAWGLWHQAGVGMTSHLGAVELERMRRQGIAPLPFEQGLALLDAVLARPADNFVPVKLDLRAVRRAAEQGQDVPALFRALVRRRLRRAPSADPATSPTGLRERLLAAPGDRRQDLVTEMVLREVATVLGVSGGGSLSPQQVLKDLGLDSLMAVELRRRLSAESGISLPATLAFDHPTPDHIARLILGRLDLPPEAPATGAPGNGASGDEDPESVLGWALGQLSADRIHRSGLLEQLVELARQESPGTAAVAAPPVAPAEEERSVDDINAELNALLEASGLDLDLD
ncbi:type I polyketide synthase [Streptomyces sp. ML-6]|uniref:type I polyketide synthase n=1 Tax=Streptomyces sp. ML-6 TaxID=2982693 RepID=UPI0024C01537|nr:type I polyketide synthase [Streptomyces sp. ML-6]MDK0524618.1 SDR family NAD(P)-dependent oxidoreductase [Streptomyces sp. ML-6]